MKYVRCCASNSLSQSCPIRYPCTDRTVRPSAACKTRAARSVPVEKERSEVIERFEERDVSVFPRPLFLPRSDLGSRMAAAQDGIPLVRHRCANWLMMFSFFQRVYSFSIRWISSTLVRSQSFSDSNPMPSCLLRSAYQEYLE